MNAGSWAIFSESDPRWNVSGSGNQEADGDLPAAARIHLTVTAERLKATAPEDLEIQFFDN